MTTREVPSKTGQSSERSKFEGGLVHALLPFFLSSLKSQVSSLKCFNNGVSKPIT